MKKSNSWKREAMYELMLANPGMRQTNLMQLFRKTYGTTISSGFTSQVARSFSKEKSGGTLSAILKIEDFVSKNGGEDKTLALFAEIQNLGGIDKLRNAISSIQNLKKFIAPNEQTNSTGP